MDTIFLDPVVAFLKHNKINCPLTQEVTFLLDQGPMTIRSNAKDLSDHAMQTFYYYPSQKRYTKTAETLEINVYCIGNKAGHNGIYPDPRWGKIFFLLNRNLKFNQHSSRSFLYARGNGLEVLWRPYDILVSFHSDRRNSIHILVAESSTKNPLSVKKKLRLKGVKVFPPNLPDIIDLIKLLYIHQHQFFCIHGAAVGLKDIGIILTGPSGAGKSTTALALVRDGFDLLSDELTLIETDTQKEIRIRGLLISPMLVGNAVKELKDLELSLDTKNNYQKTPLILPRTIVQTSLNRWCRPEIILFLEKAARQTTTHKLIPIESLDAFTRLMAQNLDLTTSFREEKRIDAIITLTESCTSYRLKLGHTLDKISELIHTCISQKTK